MSFLVQQAASNAGCALQSEKFAALMDEQDPLKKFRNRFAIPLASSARSQSLHTQGNADDEKIEDEEEAVYLCGHSLGLMPKRTRSYLNEELDKWAKMGVEGHFSGKRPWATIDERAVQLMSELVGAKPNEIAIMGSLTNNLHLLMLAFYRPSASRFKIMIEENLFCSDSHALQSQIRFHGLDPEEVLVRISPQDNESTIRTENIIASIKRCQSELALLLFGGVQYFTGQFFDLKAITEAGRAAGAVVGFDLAHAVGNVKLQLHDWGPDFACWCSYKYLNAGAGGIAGIFVHEKHDDNNKLKRLNGWWGQVLHFCMLMNSFLITDASVLELW